MGEIHFPVILDSSIVEDCQIDCPSLPVGQRILYLVTPPHENYREV